MSARIVVGQGSCGLAAGAGAVYAALEEKLNASIPASLSITGCIGICYLEPIVDVYAEDGQLYRCVQVKPADAETIVSAVEKNDYSLLSDLVIKEEDAQFLSKQTRIALRHCGIINP
ncbi:MAG: NADH-quinone oxidoreductase subunit F, partial [Ruminococcaceae bacterium]|nr:NADH-quinone oxidoreductase subunit F [Oscillospiraceae bacterium]